ncbi:MAG TPA: hypothetical protein RMH99_26375 [Sandaracinaceae bacterium LLY-WYZ-13_1]|nr:hypothetical protein [Sandaracinaceae bacterium LLY-WYZ-13_1]
MSQQGVPSVGGAGGQIHTPRQQTHSISGSTQARRSSGSLQTSPASPHGAAVRRSSGHSRGKQLR